jgi:ferric-dicitrate binding protein FerR (iron transport regulator)
MGKSRKKGIKVLNDLIELIERYERGKANDTERRALDTWIPDTGIAADKDIPNRKVLTELSAEVWHRLTQKYYLENDKGTRKRIVGSRMWNTYRRYAAAVAIILIIGSGAWFTYNQGYSLQKDNHSLTADIHSAWTTDNKHRTALTLTDGTVVQMNTDSRIEISKAAFNKEKREVWLVGEAFFEVAKNPQRPFIIHTGDMQTTVRGTSFNVKAYRELNENVVSVRRGKVEVTRGVEKLALLTADKQLRYNTTDHLSKTSDVDWQDAAGWIQGRLILNGVGAKELKLRLRQQFGVTVTILNGALSGKCLSGSFRKERTLKEVMNTIGAVYGIHYEIKENRVTITP